MVLCRSVAGRRKPVTIGERESSTCRGPEATMSYPPGGCQREVDGNNINIRAHKHISRGSLGVF